MTTDDGLLSQEDIDALTAGLAGGTTASAPAGGASVETVRPLIRLLSEQFGSVATTVLGKRVDIQLAALVAGPGEAPAEDTSTHLRVKVRCGRDLPGQLYIVLSRKTAAIMADLMMMGSGTADFEDDHRDAIAELINQVLGASSTALGSEMGIAAEFGQAETGDLDPSNGMPASGLRAELSIKIEGFPDQQGLLLLDKEFVDSADTRLVGQSAAAPATMSPSTPAAFSGAAVPSGSGNLALDEGGQHASGFASTGNRALDLLMDIDMPITIELGRTQMSLKRILELGPGAIVEMDRFAGEPVDLLVNGKVVARGEVVVVDENFGVRVVSMVTPEERIKMLR